MSALSFFKRDSGGGITLVAYHHPDESTWRWSVGWQWKRWRNTAKHGGPFIFRAAIRTNQWHDEYGPLMISRQDYHLQRPVPSPGDILEWRCPKFSHSTARWRVCGVHIGAPGQESLVEMESVSHSAGWTGQWEYHPRVFVPEPLTRHLKIVKDASP